MNPAPANPTDHARAAAPAVALALLHEPFYQAITSDCGERALAVLTDYIEYSLREAQRMGRCVFAADPAQGAAAWTLPQPPEVEAAESAAKRRHLRVLLGSVGYDNYRRIVDFMSAQLPGRVPAGAWYLSILGVHPEAQGRGIGAAMLAPTLREAADARVATYLETFDPRNHPFYRRAGFVTTASTHEPVTRAEYWIMRQDF